MNCKCGNIKIYRFCADCLDGYIKDGARFRQIKARKQRDNALASRRYYERNRESILKQKKAKYRREAL
jgi:hypothetical protein